MLRKSVVNRQVILKKGPKGIKAVIQSRPNQSVVDFDEGFPEGIFVVSKGPNEPAYNIRALDKYCSERGITPSQLTSDELSSFEILSR